jgi:hypothetical protein
VSWPGSLEARSSTKSWSSVTLAAPLSVRLGATLATVTVKLRSAMPPALSVTRSVKPVLALPSGAFQRKAPVAASMVAPWLSPTRV